jgi:hypothetical protein
MAYNGIVIKFGNGLIVGNGGDVTPPSAYKVSTEDLDLNSKRSTSGYLTRNRIRGGDTTAYTVEVSWDRISWDELVKLIAAGEDASIQLQFLDPKSKGGFATKTMYRNASMEYTMLNIDGEGEAFWATTMTFVGI